MRYWDGAGWTEHVAPNPNTSNADNNEAAWPYWGALLLGFLPALILFFSKKDQPRTRSNSAQVLNIEIVLLGIQLVGMGVWFAGFASAIATIDENTTEIPASVGLFLLVWVAFFAIFVARIVLYIWLGIALSILALNLKMLFSVRTTEPENNAAPPPRKRLNTTRRYNPIKKK